MAFKTQNTNKRKNKMEIQNDQLQAVLKSVMDLGSSSLNTTIDSTEKRLNTLIEETNAKLSGLEKNKAVLHVSVDKVETKLSSRAVPYLSRLIMNSKLGLNSLLVGPAGCGKTTAAKQLSEALDLNFGTVCLTAGASETWLFGRHTPQGFIEGTFSELYREGGVFLADEFDAADANLLLSINTALANGTMFNPMSGQKVDRHKDFVFIGAANTFGKGANHVYTGRSRLDGATLDRFILIEVDYDKDIESMLCPNEFLCAWLWDARLELKNQGFEEILSTRALINFYLQLMNGLPLQEIFKSMTLSWSDDAKEVLAKTYYAAKNLNKELPDALRVTDITKLPKKAYTLGDKFQLNTTTKTPSKKAEPIEPSASDSNSDSNNDDDITDDKLSSFLKGDTHAPF